MTDNIKKSNYSTPQKKRGDIILTTIIVLVVGFLFVWNILSYYAPQMELSGKTLLSIDGKTPETGKRTTLKIKGTHAVINFWGTWCSSCVSELPELKEASKSLNVYGILKAPYKKGSLERMGVSWTNIIAKDSLFADFKITGVPTTLFLKDGKVDRVISGVVTNSEIQSWLKE